MSFYSRLTDAAPVPAPSMSQQDQEVSLPKDLLSSFSLTPGVGP